jgi:hypothetical protein
MTFKHSLFKLSKRLAIAWVRRPRFLPIVAAFLSHLPVEARIALIALAGAVSVRLFWSDSGNRRRYQLPTKEPGRLGDRYPCWEFYVGRVVLRVAILALPKVGA